MTKKLLSICIPTYNRVKILGKTLKNIINHAIEFQDIVEICISDNASKDETEKMLRDLKNQYPKLIRYQINKKNLGYDRNLLTVLQMANGKYAWTFGDYNLIVENGLEKIIDLIKKNNNKKIGLIGVRSRKFKKEKKGKIIYEDITIDNTKGSIYELDPKRHIQNISFRGITHVILNTNEVNKLIHNHMDLIKRGFGLLYLHSWIYYLMFINNDNLKCVVLNEVVVESPYLFSFKMLIEDQFSLTCNGNIRFYGMLGLISGKQHDSYLSQYFNRSKQNAKKAFIMEMIFLKNSKRFEFISFTECIKHFSKGLKLFDALFFSTFFLFLIIIPTSLSVIISKAYLKFRFGKNGIMAYNEKVKEITRHPIGEKRREYGFSEWVGENNITYKF
jgi:glycosyltransferase involved in cell wall biosynthesis